MLVYRSVKSQVFGSGSNGIRGSDLPESMVDITEQRIDGPRFRLTVSPQKEMSSTPTSDFQGKNLLLVLGDG